MPDLTGTQTLVVIATSYIAIIKLACLIIGYLVVRLGFQLLREGIRGDFNFTAEFTGIKGGLVSASPGLLFLLIGGVLIAHGLSVPKTVNYNLGESKDAGAPPVPVLP